MAEESPKIPYPDDIAKPEVGPDSPSPRIFPDPKHEAHLRATEKERMHDEGEEKDKPKAKAGKAGGKDVTKR